jgi:hypothetical protein
LFSIRAGNPAEEVIEGAILHRHDDDVIELGRPRLRNRGRFR